MLSKRKCHDLKIAYGVRVKSEELSLLPLKYSENAVCSNPSDAYFCQHYLTNVSLGTNSIGTNSVCTVPCKGF